MMRGREGGEREERGRREGGEREERGRREGGEREERGRREEEACTSHDDRYTGRGIPDRKMRYG